MDDDETRRLILRLQMDDLASIWALSTTSTEDGTELDADVSLRLYRHELRTANQQIEDRVSARAAAEDELRQRDAMRADREEARRLFQQLNPDEPVPEQLEADQLLLIDDPNLCNAHVKDETSSALEPLQCSDQPDMRASPSLSSRQTIAHMPGVKRLADHFDTVNGPASKKHASERTIIAASQVKPLWGLNPERTQLGFAPSAFVNSDKPARSSNSLPYTFGSLKRPAQAEDVTPPPAKRQEILPKNSPLTFETTQPTAGKQASPSSSLSGPSIATQRDVLSVFDLFGKSSARAPEAPRFGHNASSRRGSTSAAPSARRRNRKFNRKVIILGSEELVSQTLPASKQPVAPGQQFISERSQSSEVECIACCSDVPHTKAYINSCSHVYCSKCVNRLFKKAVRDESLWPPQCCKTEMPVGAIEHLLREDLIPLVKARQVEMSTPLSDRTYCAGCAKFIPGDRILEKGATCSECLTSTCTVCKEKVHQGDCHSKLQQDIKDLEALAEKNGWKKCSNCLMLVEHNTGCNHMT